MKKNVYTYHMKTLGLAWLGVRWPPRTPYIEFNIKGRPLLNPCTCYPLTPDDLIHSAMPSNTEIGHSFCE